MRALTKWVLLLLVGVTGWAFGQHADKPDGKQSLEELLATALRNSPDVQVADAKVRGAQAELRRTRMTVLQRVIEGRAAVEAQQAAVVHAEVNLRRMQKLAQAANVPTDEVQRAEVQLAAARALLAQAEASLNALTGTLPPGIGAMTGEGAGVAAVTGPAVQPAPAGGVMPGMPAGALGFGGGGLGMGGEAPLQEPRGPIADKLRAALDRPVKLAPAKEKPLVEVLQPFRAAAKDVPFLIHLGEKAQEPISLSLEGEVPLGAAFQALEDVAPALRCYVREYGIIVTEDGAPPISDGMPIVTFWRLKDKAAR